MAAPWCGVRWIALRPGTKSTILRPFTGRKKGFFVDFPGDLLLEHDDFPLIFTFVVDFL